MHRSLIAAARLPLLAAHALRRAAPRPRRRSSRPRTGAQLPAAVPLDAHAHRYVSGQERARSAFVLFSKEDPARARFRNLVAYVEPPRDAGKLVLLDGSTMWFYDPPSKTSVRISAQQRLVGQASIGDVLTVNLAPTTPPTLLGEETIEDAARQNAQRLAPGPEGGERPRRLRRGRILGRARHLPPDQGQVLFGQRAAAQDRLLPQASPSGWARCGRPRR